MDIQRLSREDRKALCVHKLGDIQGMDQFLKKSILSDSHCKTAITLILKPTTKP